MSPELDWMHDACPSCGAIAGGHFMGCGRGPTLSVAGPIQPVWRGFGLSAPAGPHSQLSAGQERPWFAEPDDLDSPAGAGWEIEADRG